MKNSDINIRDPYVMFHDNKYYMYGTRSATTWGIAKGFDCYVSENLEDWEGPFEIFSNDGTFWADRNYWAPECYHYNDNFYFVTTFGSEEKMGIQILISDNLLGPFVAHTNEIITPKDWKCLDGTLYFDEDKTPYLVFGRSFQDVILGEMYSAKMSKDLKSFVEKPKFLFNASDAPWTYPIPFAKKQFNMDGSVYLVDGPSIYRTSDGTLIMLWSSWGEKGYAVGTALSKNGKITGEWIHNEKPFYSENGGHGMIFNDENNNKMYYVLHYPNDLYKEKPFFQEIIEKDNKLIKILENRV